MYTLTAPQTWAYGADLAIQQAQDIILQLEKGTACVPDNTAIGGECGDDCMGCCIRVENGVLQTLSCGVWEDVPGGDLKTLVQSSTGTPTSDGPVPAGGCKEFWMTIQGVAPVLLPVPVSAGDSIEIDQWNGAWSDGVGAPSLSAWECADGSTYILGTCTGIYATDAGDPLPTANHMSVVAQIMDTGQFLAPMGSPRYVPPGVTNSAVYLQANDATLGDNLGSVSIHVKICAVPDLPIALTWDTGNGPATAAVGVPFTGTSSISGGDQTLYLYFDRCVKLRVVNVVGWVSAGATGSPAHRDCAGTTHNHAGADISPELYFTGIDLDKSYINGDPGAVFQVQYVIDAEI